MLRKSGVKGLEGVSDADDEGATPLTSVAGDGAEIGADSRGTTNSLQAAKSRKRRLLLPICVVVVGLCALRVGLRVIPVRYYIPRDRDTGQVFSSNPYCPYILRKPEERSSRLDPSIAGNFLHFTGLNYGRMGNRFGTVSQNLKLGYCCQSKLVWLPPKDDTLAPGVFNTGTPGPRWFDFTRAPDVAGFNASSCPALIAWTPKQAFRLDGLDNSTHRYYTPNLKECIKSVPRLIGCEAAYFFPMDIDVCQSGQTIAGNRSREEQSSNEARAIGVDFEGEEAAGNLVIHIRSGDIFTSHPHPKYGQPPLQFYLRAIEHRNWDRIDVVTSGNGTQDGGINPVVTALEEAFGDGELQNIHFHKNRTFEEDLLSILCTAGGLVTARSTMANPLVYHSAASRVYISGGCGEIVDNIERMSSVQKRHKQIYRAIYSEPTKQYSPYRSWNGTSDQIAEMLSFPVAGFEHCGGTPRL
eukprot:g20199.t1